MNRAALDLLVDTVVGMPAGGTADGPVRLLLLVREYARAGREDVADALGPALERALSTCQAPEERHRCGDWLRALAESVVCSDDDRLHGAVVWLAAELSREWPSHGRVAVAADSIDACLAAVPVLAASGRADAMLGASIEELERIVAVAYVPGEGIGHVIDEAGPDGELEDHVAAASALLMAYAATGRLPYSMLAEELVQTAQRLWWSVSAGLFLGKDDQDPAFLTNCAAARMLCRMAALHRDADYREAAVIASGSDYARDAEVLLRALGSIKMTVAESAAAYGVALGEWLEIG